MTKWLIENEKREWFMPHFYIWQSDRPLENTMNEEVYEWTKDAIEAWSFDTKKEADSLISGLKKEHGKYYDWVLKSTEHEFINPSN